MDEFPHAQVDAGACGAAANGACGGQPFSADATGRCNEVGNAAAADDTGGKAMSRRADDDICGPPKRRRMRGKQSVPTGNPAAEIEVEGNGAASPQCSRVQPGGEYASAGAAICVANSLHGAASSGPSRLVTSTFTCDRDVLHQNRDGRRQSYSRELGHAADTGRPPDAAGLQRADRSLG